MNLRNGWWLGTILSVLSLAHSISLAAPPPPPPPPPQLNSTVLPDFHFDNIPLPEALAKLQDKIPDFRSVIVSPPDEPGAASGLVLPSFSAKNLTLGQFLDFIQTAFPRVQVQVIDGPNTPLYVIHILDISDGSLPAGTPSEQTVVKVYPLKDIVLSMVGPNTSEENKKKSLNDVLSLLQTALNQVDDKSHPAVLNVHEPTMTMVCKGTPAMIATLDQSISALKPTEQMVDINRRFADYRENLKELGAALEQKNMECVSKNQQIDELQHSLMEAKFRLEMVQKSDRSPTSRP